MPSGTIAPSPPGSPMRQRVRMPRRKLVRKSPQAQQHVSTADTGSSRDGIGVNLAQDEKLDDDCLRHIASMVPLIEHVTLASCARLSWAWHRAFAPLVESLPRRLAVAIKELQSNELRRSTLLRERRRALRSLDPETMFELCGSLRGHRGSPPLSAESRQLMFIAMQVTNGLAETILAATDRPRALRRVPPALQPLPVGGGEQLPRSERANTPWVLMAGEQSEHELFVWEALQHADEHLETCVPWLLLTGSDAWAAIVQVAAAQPWFVTDGLAPEHAAASPEMDALTRWSLAVMDEAGLMCSEPEVRATDAALREVAAVKRALEERRMEPSRGSRRLWGTWRGI